MGVRHNFLKINNTFRGVRKLLGMNHGALWQEVLSCDNHSISLKLQNSCIIYKSQVCLFLWLHNSI